MTTRRLIDETHDELTLDLLRSAEFDTPPNGSLRRTAAAVGISAAAFAGTALVGAGLQASGVSASANATWMVVIQGLVVGGIAGTVVVGGGLLIAETGREIPSAPAQVAVVAPAPSRAPYDSPPAPKQLASATELDEREERVSGRAASIRSPDATPLRSSAVVAAFDSAPPSQRLAAEVARIDGARKLLRSGRPAAALGEIERYFREATSRELAIEAEILRVEALVAVGRRIEAATIARGLLDSGAGGPRREFLKKVIEDG